MTVNDPRPELAAKPAARQSRREEREKEEVAARLHDIA